MATLPSATSWVVYGQESTPGPNPPTFVDATFGTSGGSLSTGTATTSHDIMTTDISVPGAGYASIEERDPVAGAPADFVLYGQTVAITAPPATAADPLVITFRIWAPMLPDGQDETTIQLFRDGVVVPPCVVPQTVPASANPSPCVNERSRTGDDIVLVALTVEASEWFTAVAEPYAFGGFLAPVDAAPVMNRAKAGSSIPLKFSLGGPRGLLIFAAGSPTFERTDCVSNYPWDDIEQTVSAGHSVLVYDADTDRYRYVWTTRRAWEGSCGRLVLRFIDGTSEVALFDLRK